MKTTITPLLLTALCLLGSAAESKAAALPLTAFAYGRPEYDLQKFFSGHTKSWGVLENGSGEPTERIATETHGRMVHGELHMEQDLFVEGKQPQHRSWKIRRLDAHHFDGTANDMVGVAHGTARGNAFHWTFTLATKPGHPLYNVTLSQHMYLLPDGSMLNRDTVRKGGIFLASVTEHFRRMDGR